MPSAPEKYEAYVVENLCREGKKDDCLEETAYLATRSDGRKVKIAGVYRWRQVDAVQGFLLPHFLLAYMRLLRNAYETDPETYGGQLYNQIDFFVTDAVDRNGALVWENKFGITQGMEQAEYANYFVTVASLYKSKGEIKLAKATLNYALRFLRAMDMPVGIHTGGVCSGEFYCGSKRARFWPARWYHSRGRGIDSPLIHTVLNQHLHVVRDIISLYVNLRHAEDLISSEFGTSHEVFLRLQNRAIAGLYQLAFSAGNTSVQRSRPPNIKQFMNRVENAAVKPSANHPDGNPLDYYWAFYEYLMETGHGKNIEHQSTCGYHTHVLDIMAGIYSILHDHQADFKSTPNGWRLYEAIDTLLDGRGEATGIPDSKNAIYQFYRSEGPAIKRRRRNCENDDLDASVIDLYSSLFD